MDAEHGPRRPLATTGWRLFLLLATACTLGWVAAASFIGSELESRAVDLALARADVVEDEVREALRAGATPTAPDVAALLEAGRGWLVDTTGRVLAGPGRAPDLPDGIELRGAFDTARIVAGVGTDGAVAVAPIADLGDSSVLLVVGERGEPVQDHVARLRWLLAGIALGVTLLVGGVGASMMRHVHLRLEQRNAALTALLRRERETVEKLGEVDAMKSAFLTAISHELRTPLTVVAGFTELLAARGEQLSREQISQLARGLEDKTRRLTHLIDDLLDVDRLSRGVMEPDRRPVDVAALVARTTGAMVVPEHELRLDVTAGTYEVDPAHLQRVVENLVRNAIKHAPSGTAIDVVAQPDEDGGLELIVADRGPGVPDARKAAVFEPLQRVDADDPNPGLGVGLALVAQLAQLHGGEAWLTDRDGGGLEAHVRFAGAFSH